MTVTLMIQPKDHAYKKNGKVIVRIQAGLGNQLFCYSAARRLSFINNAELVIDSVNGFSRDLRYSREYSLGNFCIPCRTASSKELLEPFGRYRLRMLEILSRSVPLSQRSYLREESMAFDQRFLDIKVSNRVVYLDGYWQSEKYFEDIEDVIREDLRFIPPQDLENQRMGERISQCSCSVGLHVRWFDSPFAEEVHNVSYDYYCNAVTLLEKIFDSPYYFVFSDDPVAAARKVDLPKGRFEFVSHNKSDHMAYADMWLMSKCKHFIIANSTFSWWGAWLGQGNNKKVIAPKIKLNEAVTKWGFDGLIPDEWTLI
jgi:hypothetical protein